MTTQIIESLNTYRKVLVNDLKEQEDIRSNATNKDDIMAANLAINSLHIQIAIVDERLIKLNKEEK